MPPKDKNELLGQKPRAADSNSLCEHCFDTSAAVNLVVHMRCAEYTQLDLSTVNKASACVCFVKDFNKAKHTGSFDKYSEVVFVLDNPKHNIEQQTSGDTGSRDARR